MAIFEWYSQVETRTMRASFALRQKGSSFAYIGEHVSDNPTISILTRFDGAFDGKFVCTIEVEDHTGNDLVQGSNVKLIQYSYKNELWPVN